MTKEAIQLIGKWQFIGAEIYRDSKWQPNDNYVEGMTWEFYPQYFGANKCIGNIVERSPSNSPINMTYAYNKSKRVLKIEIFTDLTIGVEDGSEADIYEIVYSENNSIIKASILTQQNCPPPHFRYTLKRLEEFSTPDTNHLS